MSDQNGGSQEPEREEPIIRDKRRIDPETGKVRQPEGEQTDAGENDLSHEELVDVGPADADPVLLLHGEPSWGFLYRHVVDVLVAAGHRCVVPDLVGFGRSDKPADTAPAQ